MVAGMAWVAAIAVATTAGRVVAIAVGDNIETNSEAATFGGLVVFRKFALSDTDAVRRDRVQALFSFKIR